MKRIFGASPKKPAGPPPPTLAEASGRLQDRLDHLDKQIAGHDAELAKLKRQIVQAKNNRSLEASLKQKAMAVLKRRKMCESQRENIMNTQFNVEQTQFATESLEATAVTVDAMKAASTQLKQQFKALDLDTLEDLHDDMADLMLDQEEINHILGRSFTTPVDVDEAELEAEFAALQEGVDVEEGEEDLSYLPSTTLLPPLPGSTPKIDAQGIAQPNPSQSMRTPNN